MLVKYNLSCDLAEIADVFGSKNIKEKLENNFPVEISL